jgi:hypothetical protein
MVGDMVTTRLMMQTAAEFTEGTEKAVPVFSVPSSEDVAPGWPTGSVVRALHGRSFFAIFP